jgi:IMP dehydrogenase
MIPILNALDFSDVLIVPGYSEITSRSLVDTSWVLQGKERSFTFSLPVISANMSTITEEKMAIKMNELGGLGIIHRYMSLDKYEKIAEVLKKANAPLAFSVGVKHTDLERIQWCIKNADIICIDIAHGHSKMMEETLILIGNSDFSGAVIAGNIATYYGASFLGQRKASAVKVGIGPGSVCTTRLQTGCGVHQLTAIIEASQGHHTVIADGGIKFPGDVCKAIAGGASAVMIGGILAGTDCTPDWNLGEDHVKYEGMASHSAREKFGKTENSYEEGMSIKVRSKPVDSTEQVIKQIKEGLQSACSYVGAQDLKTFKKNARFVVSK